MKGVIGWLGVSSLPASTNQALPHQASCMQQTFDWLYASAHTGSSRPVFGCPLLLRFVCILPFNQSMWALRCIGRAWLARYARFPRSWRAWPELYGCTTRTWLKRLIRNQTTQKYCIRWAWPTKMQLTKQPLRVSACDSCCYVCLSLHAWLAFGWVQFTLRHPA